MIPDIQFENISTYVSYMFSCVVKHIFQRIYMAQEAIGCLPDSLPFLAFKKYYFNKKLNMHLQIAKQSI